MPTDQIIADLFAVTDMLNQTQSQINDARAFAHYCDASPAIMIEIELAQMKVNKTRDLVATQAAEAISAHL